MMITAKAGAFKMVQVLRRARDLDATVTELLSELEGECAAD
jgi:hypothetical protein